MKRLIGVGVGPGDPELVTVKAIRVLREADVVLVPVLAGGPGSGGPEPGRAETIVRAYVAAECAGLLYLARTLDQRPMCGVLDVRATMTPKLTLGYRHAVAATDSVLARAGDVVRGHEFHRTVAVPASGHQPAWTLATGAHEGHVTRSCVASYLHTHWAGHPAAAARFAAACAEVKAP